MYLINKDHFVFFPPYNLLALSNFTIMDSQSLNSDFILSSDLAEHYSHLPSNLQSVFVKLFREIYNYLLPATRITSHGGVLFTYFLVNQQRKKYALSVRDLDLLTLLYYHSSGGRETIRTDRLKEQFPDFTNRIFISLQRKGYIKRHTWDPIAPSYRSCRSHRPIFIRLTPTGVGVIKKIEGDLRKTLYHSLKTIVTTEQ
jgi:hypothetical protein